MRGARLRITEQTGSPKKHTFQSVSSVVEGALQGGLGFDTVVAQGCLGSCLACFCYSRTETLFWGGTRFLPLSCYGFACAPCVGTRRGLLSGRRRLRRRRRLVLPRRRIVQRVHEAADLRSVALWEHTRSRNRTFKFAYFRKRFSGCFNAIQKPVSQRDVSSLLDPIDEEAVRTSIRGRSSTHSGFPRGGRRTPRWPRPSSPRSRASSPRVSSSPSSAPRPPAGIPRAPAAAPIATGRPEIPFQILKSPPEFPASQYVTI